MDHLNDVLKFGLGEAILISALQGDGMADIAILIKKLKAGKRELEGYDEEETFDPVSENDDEMEDKPLQIAVIGRQNVGKSTLVNTLLQNDRVLTGPTPGLTRDAIAVEWTWEGQTVQLVDTAGIRKFTGRSNTLASVQC
jgi:GTP-binding protein